MFTQAYDLTFKDAIDILTRQGINPTFHNDKFEWQGYFYTEEELIVMCKGVLASKPRLRDILADRRKERVLNINLIFGITAASKVRETYELSKSAFRALDRRINQFSRIQAIDIGYNLNLSSDLITRTELIELYNYFNALDYYQDLMLFVVKAEKGYTDFIKIDTKLVIKSLETAFNILEQK